ncbi:MAG: hypothetical protein AAFX85_08035 [Pseudomonadota bacterium]
MTTFGPADPALVAEAVSQGLLGQLLEVLILIPGHALCRYAITKGQYRGIWGLRYLRVQAWLHLLYLPIVTALGVHLRWLLSRARAADSAEADGGRAP